MTTTERPGGAPIRVVLVDDDALVRAGLRMILGGASDIHIVGEAGDGAEGVAVVDRHRPDVVLMDIRMPRRDGLEATRELMAAGRRGVTGGPPDVASDGGPDDSQDGSQDGGPEDGPRAAHGAPVRVIVLTTFDADDMVLEALRAGASGFLLKDTEPARLVEAVRAVAAGEPILSPSVTARLMRHVAAGAPGPSPTSSTPEDDRRASAVARLGRLTGREHEVALAIGRGLSNAEISRTLFMSVPTVKAHVSRILTKLGADNRVQIAITVHEADSTP